MSLKSLLYVSESLLRLPDDADILDRIVGTSQQRNAERDITGALIASRGHFAQILEGPDAGVEATMARIAGDPRHRRVTVVIEREAGRRRFETWTMLLAYAGNSFYVDRHISPLLDVDQPQQDRGAQALQLFHLVHELAHADRR